MKRGVLFTMVFALAGRPSPAGTPPAAKTMAPSAIAICAACHGSHGEGSAAALAPRLAGQSEEYLKKQLRDYSSGARENPIMANFAKALTPSELDDVAAFLSTTAAPHLASTAAASPQQLARGHQFAYQGDESRQAQSCDSCHGPDGVGVLHSSPYLSGQSSYYLRSALKAFQSDARKNDAGELMRSMVKRLTDEDITAISAYYERATASAAQPGLK